jgi:2-methylcitrate dehydratase PrpD
MICGRGLAPGFASMSQVPASSLAPSPVTRHLAGWISDLSLEDVPRAVRERAKLLILDGLGCGLTGAGLPWSRTATEAICGLEGEGTAALIGAGRGTSPTAAALLNSAYIQAFELDDYHPAAPLHNCSLVLPAMLAALPGARNGSGANVLLGAIRGFEVGPRVGLALHGAQMLTRGWHSGPVFGGPAAAAAAGTIYRLDAVQMEEAFGIAATQACGLMAAQFEAMVKRMQHGFAARNGLLAAALARAGYTGIKQVFERPYGGYLSTFGGGHDPDPGQIDGELGERWETLRIAVKPYAAMAGLHAAIDAAREILQQGPIERAEVRGIEIWLSEPAFHHGGWRAERPLTTVGAQMNVAYAAAVTLLDGAALAAQFAPERIDADDVWELIARTTIRHETAFDERYEDGYNTRLRVTFLDGGEREAFVEHPRGGLARPLSEAEVIDKFRTLTQRVIEPDRSAAIEQTVLAIEELDDARELVSLLAARANTIFGHAPEQACV